MIYRLGVRVRTTRRILDGFIFITIAGIVAIHIIPEALARGGNPAIAFLLLGIAFPMVIERVVHEKFAAAHGFVLALAALGLVIHSILDGIALLPTQNAELAYAVILHRLPVGMAIWWSLRPNLGLTAAVAAFAMIIV
ncbi:MAG: metal transporter, partial [Proteobacteria bacterium]|nr:metal transporter [Pseudomonadota bacterium]